MFTLDQAAIPVRAHCLVAVSGGADSVALLLGLQAQAKARRWRLTVAHLDHGIRGASARADAEFVRTLAGQLKIPCIVGRARVPTQARRAGLSLEMAARQTRYAFLVRTARQVGADVIATAHTADDQVETVLLKFLRGAGRGGLSGIDAETEVSGIRVVRPLLAVTRSDIEAYLRAQNQVWCEDESNVDTAFLRNRIRHELIPLLERDYNPGVRQTVLRSRSVLAAEDEWLDELARGILAESLDPLPGGVRGGFPLSSLHSDRLRTYPLAARRRVIRLWLYGQGVPEEGLGFEPVSQIDALIQRTDGSERLELPGGWAVCRQYCKLAVVAPGAVPPAPQERVRLDIPGTTPVPGLSLVVTASLGRGLVRAHEAGPGQLPAKASLNAVVWGQRTLWIRSWQPGDRMIPFGMTGSRKIQDILVDAKVPRAERSRIPVVECEGEIIWIPGYRIAASWAVTRPDSLNLQMNVERV